jgi:hypothetical protein
MKKLLLSALFLILITSLKSQETKTDVLQGLEKNQANDQTALNTAKIKSATRLFKDKDDLTSVILVIPQDSTVYVIGSDDTFLQVDFGGNEGFIYARHAEINKPVTVEVSAATDPSAAYEAVPVREPKMSRYEYLEKKYGSSTAARLYSHKIWKGMNSRMVQDSWGSPKKINRFINDNEVNEEWYYSNTWLHFQNNILTDWGPVKK